MKLKVITHKLFSGFHYSPSYGQLFPFLFFLFLFPHKSIAQSYRYDSYTFSKSDLSSSEIKKLGEVAQKIEASFNIHIDTAFKEIVRDEKIYNVKDSSVSAYFNAVLGDCYRLKGEPLKANNYYFKALLTYETLHDTINGVRIITSLGELYRSSGAYGNALKFLYLAMEKNAAYPNLRNLANIHGRLAAVYYELIINRKGIFNEGEFENAMLMNFPDFSYRGWKKLLFRFTDSSMKVSISLKDTFLIIKDLNLLGCYYMLTNELNIAIKTYKKAIDLIECSIFKRDEALVMTNLSIAYFRKGNLKEALLCAQAANESALHSNIPNYIWMSAHILYLLYKDTGDLKKSLHYKELDDSVRITLINDQSGRQINELQEKYLSQQQTYEIKELKKEKAKSRSDLIMITVFGSIILVIVILIILIYSRWQRDRFYKKKAEEENRIKEELLHKAESANLAKSEFLANISHEIRTPLNAMLGFAELLNEKLTEPKYKSFIDGIVVSGRNLQNLINDILDLSRLEVGKMQLYNEPVNLELLFNEIIGIFKYKALEKNLVLNLDINSDTDYYFYTDEVRLKQILLNLLSNSIKFTIQGNIHVSVSIITNEEDPDTSRVAIMVADTGIGIHHEEKEKIFEAFRQEVHQNYSEKYSGTGLGLAITKRIIEMMNGTISIDSVKSKGTIVTVVLPGLKKAEAPPVIIPGEYFFSENIIFNEANILLVEDISSNRKMINAFLKPYNFCINEAVNGREALNILNHLTPDLILMDIQMPELDGLQTLVELKKIDRLRKIPVIALTAFPLNFMAGDIVSRFDSFVLKPVSKKTLINELKKYLKFTMGTEDTKGKDIKQSSDLRRSLSEGALSAIENELMKKWENIKLLMSKDEIEEFALVIKSFGEENNIHVFIAWAGDIAQSAEEFNIRKLYDTYNQFRMIVDKL